MNNTSIETDLIISTVLELPYTITTSAAKRGEDRFMISSIQTPFNAVPICDLLNMSGKDTVQNTILLLGKSSPTPLQNNYKIKIHSNFDIDDIANHYVVDIVVVMKDELKILKPTYGNYIINLESSKDGNKTHWLGLNIDENRY